MEIPLLGLLETQREYLDRYLNMKLTEEFMKSFQACDEAYQMAVKEGYLENKTIDETIEYCKNIGRQDFVRFLEQAKTTEKYVRLGGKNIRMINKYKIFNPIDGQHSSYNSLAEAKNGMIEVINQILTHYKISVSQVISNENGDEAWIPIDFNVKNWIKTIPDNNPVI